MPLENVLSRGAPAEFLHNSAFGTCGGGAIELIETVSLAPERVEKYLSAQLGEVDSTLHDASAVLGHDIEIHVDCEGLRNFFEMVRSGAEGWDGSEPLRPVES